MTETVMVKKKHAGGRPRKDYKVLLPANWRDIILRMSIDGCAECEIRAAIMSLNGQSYTQVEKMFMALKDNEPEFLKAISIAKIYAEAWWANVAKENLKTKHFQGYTWFLNMKNRFGDHWKDKTEVSLEAPEGLFAKYQGIDPKELEKKAIELITGNPVKAA